ncbi:MAG: serine hydrolase domain-containing protein [Gemmatirosa sp.]
MSPRIRLRTIVVALAATCVGASTAAAQADRAALSTRLDSIAGAAVAGNRAVGIVAAVVRGTDTLLMKSYGRADVEWNVPMPTDATFEIGSIAKQVTAVAVLQLRDAGKLSLDDDVTKWLPDFDTRGNEVPLRRLLDHTSGIHDFTETPEFRSLVSNRVFPRDSAYALIKRHPFDFPTGERQLYNNSAFFLLGLIVEKASGMTYEDFVEQKLFAPLGMTRSMYGNYMENVARRAHGYGLQNGQVWRMPTNITTWALGAGGLYSTAADLVTWLTALHGGRVLSPKSYAEMMAPATLGNGMKLRYGMGVGVYRDVRGLDVVEHGGIVAGFRSEARWYPEAKAAVVVLTNTTGGIDPEMIARDLGTALVPARPATQAFAGDPAPLLGRYRGRGTSEELTVEVTHGPQGLMISGNGSPPRPLPWIEGRTFLFNNIYLTFGRPGDPGPATELGFNPAKGLFFVLARQ